MKVLVFNLWGDYAHFRKFYTTSSPLSFSFPPPSTVAGILGAIYGAGKNEYLDLFSPDKCRIALKIENFVKKVRMGINLINTKENYWIPYGKKNHEPRTQIRTEFLKDPHFKVYFLHNDERVLERLIGLVKAHKSIYTVSLGLSELLADFRYIGVYTLEEVSDEKVTEVSTPVASAKLIPDGLSIEPGKRYIKEKIPIAMNRERVIERYDDIIFEPEGKPIKARVKIYWRIENGENIVFF